MRLFTLAATFALLAIVALADEVPATTVHLKIGGVSWAVSWGKAITKSLEGLEGASNVKSTSTDEFDVTFKGDSKFSPSVIKSVLPKKYSIEAMQVATEGQLAVSDKPEEKGLWLVLKSGQKVSLANRTAKDDKDKPEDVVAKLSEAQKAGSKAARVEGLMVEDKDGNLSLQLTKGEAVAAKVEEKK